MILVGESKGSKCNTTCMDKELHYLVSYDAPLSICNFFTSIFSLKQWTDRVFTVKLVSLVRDIRGVMEMNKDLYGRMKNQDELIKGRFIGIKNVGKILTTTRTH
ncbi:hypothetical protein MKX03_006236 [Papaver bracteatum]|nr:hypothetical protein MKX03_006236 [Papaver bracteatum]